MLNLHESNGPFWSNILPQVYSFQQDNLDLSFGKESGKFLLWLELALKLAVCSLIISGSAQTSKRSLSSKWRNHPRTSKDKWTNRALWSDSCYHNCTNSASLRLMGDCDWAFSSNCIHSSRIEETQLKVRTCDRSIHFPDGKGAKRHRFVVKTEVYCLSFMQIKNISDAC